MMERRLHGRNRCVVHVGASGAVGQVCELDISFPYPFFSPNSSGTTEASSSLGSRRGRSGHHTSEVMLSGGVLLSGKVEANFSLAPCRAPFPTGGQVLSPATGRAPFRLPSAGRCSGLRLSSPVPCRCPLCLAASSSQIPWLLAAVTSHQHELRPETPATALPNHFRHFPVRWLLWLTHRW
jgi:hypothetical protein